MRLVLVFCLCCGLTGCGLTMDELQPPSLKEPDFVEVKRRFISLRPVRLGMTRSEVKSVLARPVVVGYELSDPDTQQYKPITRDNPQRSEVVSRGARRYAVDYYITAVNHQDAVIADDELVPLVFFDDKLVGMGWEYLNNLKK